SCWRPSSTARWVGWSSPTKIGCYAWARSWYSPSARRRHDVRGGPGEGCFGDHHRVQRQAVRQPLAQGSEVAGRREESRGGSAGMIVAHKIALDPNNVQATYFAKAAGTARFAYNWALAEWQRQYEAWKQDNSLPKPSQAALRRQLNAIKREKFPWMLEVTKNAPQMAIIQLGEAFKNFFVGRAKYPQFRKKGKDDRFTLTNDQFSIDGCVIRIPDLGWVRMRESLRFAGKIMSATVSRVADRWVVSITVQTEDLSHLPEAKNQGVVGVDLGVSALATLSTGEAIHGPKPHRALSNRLRRLSRSLSRKQKGSANRKKAKAKLRSEE